MLDRCVWCYGRIWPWQHGGEIYNSLWHKKCEFASNKGSDRTDAWWRSKMEANDLLPPEELLIYPEVEPYDNYLERRRKIREYLVDKWRLDNNIPSWSIDLPHVYQTGDREHIVVASMGE